MKKIKINKQDEKMLRCVLNTYPLIEEEDKDSLKFNKELITMVNNILKELEK